MVKSDELVILKFVNELLQKPVMSEMKIGVATFVKVDNNTFTLRNVDEAIILDIMMSKSNINVESITTIDTSDDHNDNSKEDSYEKNDT